MKRILKLTFFLFLFCLVSTQALRAQSAKISLDKGWEFHEYNGSKPELGEWRSATVPGLIHTDLMAQKLIPDPFYRDNEKKVQWVSDSEWEYRKTFAADQNLLKRKHVDLVFEGLNTLADVSINGKVIMQTDNMFREWRMDIKTYLKPGSNTLSIIFHPIKPELARLDKAHPDDKDTSALAKLLGGGPKNYIRKAAYEGGWDWGPNIVTCGIWRPLYLQTWGDQRILDLGIEQSDITTQAAHINANVRVLSAVNANAILQIAYTQNGAGKSFTYPVTLHAGINEISYPMDIASPKLWYPNGYGKQDMYRFNVTLTNGGHTTDEVSTKAGLRSVVLNRERDSLGRKFEFIVNGIPVFAKGANIIPFDHFPTRMTAERYHKFLQAAADAHMNMMRLWGGGYYETQEFYNQCDELGIMIWQDFMFANATPPGFLKENVAKEVEYQIRRLRNHPCIAIWCGNNEIFLPGAPFDPNLIPDAFKSLLTKMMSAPTPAKTYFDYYETFRNVIPVITNRLTPEIPYTSSSPNADFDKQTPQFRSGDTHNYSVWWNNKNIEEQANYKDRFVSETGIQGFPDMATIDAFTEPDDRSVTSKIMNAHQKNFLINGNTVIGKIIKTEYKDPADFADFDYLAQLVQGESLKIYAEAMRRRRPFSMGFLYWQLNDSWPVVSWATTDYYGRPKAGMYMAKRFYAPLLVSPVMEDDKLNVFVVSDEVSNTPVTLTVKLMDFSGKVLLSQNLNYVSKALSSNIAASWTNDELKKAGYDESKTFVSLVIKDANGNILSSNSLCFKKPKDLDLQKAIIKTDLQKQGSDYILTLTSTTFAPAVGVSFGDTDATLSENFIDLLPNEKQSIVVKSKEDLEKLKIALKIQRIN